MHEPGTIDQPFAMVTGVTSPTNVKFLQQDELGNVIGNLENGAVTQTVSYDAWGNPTVAIDGTNRLLWKGLLSQGDMVKLHYMRNRWYDPDLGRFISEDPIGLAGGLNQYTFANSDPTNGIDPSGLCTLPISIAIAGVCPKVIVRTTPGGTGPTSHGYGSPTDYYVVNAVDADWTDPSGGGGETATRSALKSAAVPRIGRRIAACALNHYGLNDLALRGISWLGAVPLNKRAWGLASTPGASRYTNPISYIGLEYFQGAKLPFQLKLLGTTRLFGALGRANVVTAIGLLLTMRSR